MAKDAACVAVVSWVHQQPQLPRGLGWRSQPQGNLAAGKKEQQKLQLPPISLGSFSKEQDQVLLVLEFSVNVDTRGAEKGKEERRTSRDQRVVLEEREVWMDIPILVVVGLAFIIAITILLNKCRRELCGNCGELCDLGTGQNTEENRPLLGENDDLQQKINKLEKENGDLQEKLNLLHNELDWRRAHDETDNITLDANTAHPNLCIDEDEKSFKHEAQPQKVPSNPERFDSTVCVLGSQGFSSGKHYWEVDVEKSSDWDLGVARKSTKRKGKLSLSPKEGFWALGLNGRDYWAKTDPWTRVMVQKKTKKIGVYLSYQERRVTFFSVTDMSVLFTFNDCSFSGEVYPFFKNSHKETTMSICSFKQKE
ncbi:uncharacterized protein LOC141976807 [Natator depressus]|uniref:uncharacterized protein LOC141976807 n=1 Tax=Natator depressus TaxID=27790 RepID=UPI003EC03711